MYKIALLVSSLILSLISLGQGCSDAGVCTINSFKPDQGDTIKELLNQIKVGAYYGDADNDITVYGSYVEYNRKFGERFSLDAKLTSIAQTGNGISVFGLSDLTLTSNYSISDQFNVVLGTKLPLTDANRMRNGLSLPMDYQSSLGTVDLIFGMRYAIKKFQIVAALQQPLTQNSNQFLASNYPSDSPLSGFASTNNFIRSGDVMMRLSYPFTIKEKLTLTPSLLPIYHLTTDKFTDLSGTQREIAGSDGLTLNGNFYVDYTINENNAVQFNIGAPFIVRPSRPDGLTRSLIATVEYRITF